MTKTDVAKKAVSIVVGLGARRVVGQMISSNTTSNGAVDAVIIPVATFVLVSIAANACKRYTDQAIDEIVQWWQENVTK